MQWSRLYQPRNPLFWLLVVLNILNAGLVLLLNSQANNMTLAGLLIVAGFALVNAFLSMWLTWRLIKNPSF